MRRFTLRLRAPRISTTSNDEHAGAPGGAPDDLSSTIEPGPRVPEMAGRYASLTSRRGLIVVALSAVLVAVLWIPAVAQPSSPGAGSGSEDPPGGASPDVTATATPAEVALEGPPGSPYLDIGELATPTPTPVEPTPSPTRMPSKPAPTPRATPKAPEPAPRPTPRPAATPAGIKVPASIDATGSRDASAALIAFIGRVRDGSTIVFKRGGVYRLNGAIKFAHRRNLTLNGNGATLRSYGSATEAGSLFWLSSSGGGNTGITIKNFKLVGNNPAPGVYHAGREGAAGVLVDGGSHINIYGVTVSRVWGDCLKVNSWASYISFRDSNCVSVGRNGVSIIAGRYVTVQRVAFRKNGYNVFDIEANRANEGAVGIKFLANTAGTWTNAFFSGNGAVGSVVSGVTISGNRITGGTLLTVITIARRKNIVFTNNTSTVRGHGPILRFAHIDGLTVRGNHQPLSSGSLVSIIDCTRVQYP